MVLDSGKQALGLYPLVYKHPHNGPQRSQRLERDAIRISHATSS